MADLYMPSVTVEIAFTSGYTTPAASRVWTDVTDYVELAEGMDITVGRQDERSTAGANQLSLTLDNSDGRFTAMRSASPYYPNVKIGRPIRVRATPPGGTTSTRFVGFMDEWPVEWEGSDAYAKAKIRATSRLARLGLSAELKSMPEQAVLAAGPTAYWTLGDPSGAALAADSSGRNTAPIFLGTRSSLSTTAFIAPTFGNAIGSPYDDLTAAEFPGGTTTRAALGGSVPLGVVRSIRLLFSGSSDPGTNVVIELAGSDGAIGLQDNASGTLLGYFTPPGSSSTLMTGTGFATGTLHDAVVTTSSSGSKFYIDGALVASSGSGINLNNVNEVRMLGNNSIRSLFVIAHVATFDYELSATQVADQAQAMLNGYRNERTDQRVVRLLGWAGVAASEVTTDTGSETVTYQQTSGRSVIDSLRDVETTESGVLYDRPDGNVAFKNRSARYLATPAATLNMASQHVGADYLPKLDRSALINDATVNNPTTGESARASNSASITEYGAAPASSASVASTYDSIQQAASWTVNSYAEPRIRVPSLTVDALAHQGLTPSGQTLLGIAVGDLLAVTNAPTQADSTTASYFVEGYTERIGTESYELTFNLSPTYPTLNVLVLDDATRGKLDSGYVLAL